MFHVSLREKANFRREKLHYKYSRELNPNIYKIGFIKFNMISSLISLVSYGYFGGGAIGNVLAQWEQAGVFSYMLPFLLIFAMIFGILVKTNLFKDNKSLNAIIALAVSLMALQFDFVSIFFSELFPRVAIGLIILLVVMILLGMFLPNEKWVNYTLFGIGAIVLISVLINSSKAVNFFGGGGGFLRNIYWPDLWPLIILIIAIVLVIGIPKNKNPEYGPSKFLGDLFGGNAPGR